MIMFVVWLLVAIPTVYLIRRYAYGGFSETPVILTRVPYNVSGSWRVVGYIAMLVPFLYFLATLGLVAAWWSAYGWGYGVIGFVVGSAVFRYAHSAAWKRAARDIYAGQIEIGVASGQAWETTLIVMERRAFWPPGDPSRP
ncbi:MAG: hypothetical protein FJX74_13760 [Armatimonadetes bacterium]|nr:hypothetical protein [Armatimonadota bacterium]